MNTTLDPQPELPEAQAAAADRAAARGASATGSTKRRRRRGASTATTTTSVLAVKFRRTSDGALRRVVHDGRRKDPDEPRAWKMNSNTRDVPFLGRRPRTSPAALVSRAAARPAPTTAARSASSARSRQGHAAEGVVR